jgi:hypothetical protein
MVRDWFYPDRAEPKVMSFAPVQDMRQRAIDKVNLWLFKAGALPPGIVATANLTEALLHDEYARGNNSTQTHVISDQAMQSIYAMAFARFVNGFVDRDVARSFAAEMATKDIDGEAGTPSSLSNTARGESSMYAHAATVGMPESFVNLRHQVTHGEMPSLYYLRTMTIQAMSWLWEKWWIKNATGNSGKALREMEERKRIIAEANHVRMGTTTRDTVMGNAHVDADDGPA